MDQLIMISEYLILTHMHIAPYAKHPHNWCYIFSSLGITQMFLPQLQHNDMQSVVHSVETPSIVDPQSNMLYWGPRCYFHTASWDAVGCEWAVSGWQPLFTLGLPTFALSLEYFLSLPWGPSTNIDFLKFMSVKIICRTQTKSLINFM